MRAREDLTAVLEAEPHVRLAVLFGSAAAGRLRARSDIDLAILLDDASAMTPQVSAALSRAAGRQVDVILLHNAPPLLRFEIARTGVVLIERVPHAWADFRARAMIDWWDWAPTARMMHAVAASRLREVADRGTA